MQVINKLNEKIKNRKEQKSQSRTNVPYFDINYETV